MNERKKKRTNVKLLNSCVDFSFYFSDTFKSNWYRAHTRVRKVNERTRISPLADREMTSGVSLVGCVKIYARVKSTLICVFVRKRNKSDSIQIEMTRRHCTFQILNLVVRSFHVRPSERVKKRQVERTKGITFWPKRFKIWWLETHTHKHGIGWLVLFVLLSADYANGIAVKRPNLLKSFWILRLKFILIRQSKQSQKSTQHQKANLKFSVKKQWKFHCVHAISDDC